MSVPYPASGDLAQIDQAFARVVAGPLAKTNQISKTRGCYELFLLHRRSTRREVDMSRTPPAAAPPSLACAPYYFWCRSLQLAESRYNHGS